MQDPSNQADGSLVASPGGARELQKMREANALVDKAEGAEGYHMAMIALALVTRQYLRELDDLHADAAHPRASRRASSEELTERLHILLAETLRCLDDERYDAARRKVAYADVLVDGIASASPVEGQGWQPEKNDQE